MLLSINPVRYPTFQSIVILPMSLRLEYADEMEKFLQEPDVDSLFSSFELTHLTRYINYMRTMQEPHNDHEISVDALARDFKSFFTQYDQRRGKDFAAAFPRLANWYNNIT
jgi:hypothetical protein